METAMGLCLLFFMFFYSSLMRSSSAFVRPPFSILLFSALFSVSSSCTGAATFGSSVPVSDAFARHTVRIIREYVQIRQQFCVDLFYDLLCQHTVRLIFYIRLVHNRVNNSFRVFYRCKSDKGNEIFSIASRILLCSTCFSSIV